MATHAKWLMLAMAFAMTVSVGSAQIVTVTTGDYLSEPGQAATVEVSVDNTEDLGEFTLIIEFDGTLAVFDDVFEVDVGARANDVEWFLSGDDDRLVLLAGGPSGDPAVEEGDGVLFRFKLIGLAHGVTSLTYPTLSASTAGGVPIDPGQLSSTDGQVDYNVGDIVFAPAAGTYAEAQTVSLSSEASTSIRYTTDGSTPDENSTLYVNPFQVSGPDMTTVDVKAIAFSSAGNSKMGQATYGFDSTLPTVTIDVGSTQDDPTNDSNIVFDVVFSEDMTGFAANDIMLGGTASPQTAVVAGGPSDYTVTVSGMSQDGSVTMIFGSGVAENGVGADNASPTIVDNSVVYDTAPPTVTVNPLLTNDTTPELTGTIDDPLAMISILVGGQTNPATNNGNGTWTLADNTLVALAELTFEVTATATDLAGNAASDGSSNELTIDTTEPTVSVDSLLTNDNTPAITGMINDNDADIQVTIDGQTKPATNHGNGMWSVANDVFAAIDEGVHDVMVAATDLAGNVGNDETDNELEVDVTPPTVTVNALVTNDTTPALSGDINDANATVTIQVDGQLHPATNNGATWSLADDVLTALDEGVFEVLVTATDMAGNEGTDGSSNELEIDLTPPTVTVDPLATNDTTPALTGMINDPDATISLTVGGQPKTPVNNQDGTWILPDDSLFPLAETTFDVIVTATDGVGNIGNDQTTNELKIDLTDPTITVDDLTTRDTTPALSGTVDEADATIEITVNGQTVSATNNGNGTWSLANDILNELPEAVYEIEASATDPAGNTGEDGSNSELTIDVVNVTVDVLITNDSTPALSGTVEATDVSIEITVDGQVVMAVNDGDGSWSLADDILTSLDDGVYNVTARTEDAASNVTTDSSTNELTIDTVPPVITVEPATVTLGLGDAEPDLLAGVTANDNVSGDISNAVTSTGTVDVNTMGTYNIDYDVMDEAGNAAITKMRVYHVGFRISGTITYDGAQAGDGRVEILNPAREALATIPVPGGSGAYTGPVVIDPGTYMLRAYIDSTPNAMPDAGEAIDQYSQLALAITANVTGVDFVLSDWEHTLELERGWNSFSVPGPLVDDNPDIWFPSRVGDVLFFDNGQRQYTSAAAITPKLGFWLFVMGEQSVLIRGTEAADPTVNLGISWNFVGVSQNLLNPRDSNVLIDAPIWQWQNYRFQAVEGNDTLNRFSAYWIRATAPTTIGGQ